MAQKKTYRLLSLAVMAVVLTALLALSAVAADLSTGFGKILGDVSGYEAASVVLNSTGDDIAELDYFDLDKDSNSGLAGLYYVRPEGSTEKGELIYVYGSYADRKHLFTYNEAGTSLLNSKGSDFVEGTWTLSGNINPGAGGGTEKLTGSSPYFYLHHQTIVHVNKSSKYWFLTNTRDTFLSMIESNTNKETLISLADTAYYRNSEYYDVTEVEGVEVFTLNEAGNEAREDLFLDIKADLESVTHRYAFSPADVVPVEDFTSIYFKNYVNVYGLEGSKFNNTNVTFYVIDKNGSVTPYTYADGTTRSGPHNLSMTATLSAVENAPTTGWIIGIKIVPYGGVVSLAESGGAKFSTAKTLAACFSSGTSGGSYQMQIHTNSYKISLPQGPKPYGLTFDEMTVSGLDKNVTYNARPYTINGVDTESDPVVISGVEEYTFDEAGLWAISCATCDDYTESDYVLVYAKGLASDRHDIMTRTDDGKYNIANSTDFQLGTITSNSDATNSTLNFILGLTSLTDFGKYTVDADQNKVYTLSDDDAKTLFDNNASKFQSKPIRYGFTSDEIIPVSDIVEFKYAFVARYCNFYYSGLESKFVLHVVTPDSEKKTYEYIHTASNYNSAIGDSYATKSIYSTYPGRIMTVDFSNKESAYGIWTEFPTDGYVIGFEFYPFYGMNSFGNVTRGGSQGNHSTISATNNFAMNLDSANYVIKTPKAATPEGLETVDSVLSGLDDELTYIARPYAINGVIEGAEPVTITNVPEFDFATVDGAGLYAVSVAANGLEWSESDAVLVYIRGDYEDRANILDVNANGANVWESSSEFVVGSLSTSYSINGTSGSSDDYAQNDIVQAISGSKYLATAPDSSDPTAVENMKTKFEKSAETISATFFKYAFDSDEIVPISEVVSYKWGLGVHYTQFRYTANISSKFVAYVMDDDGNIESYEYIHAAAPFTSDIELSDSYVDTNLMTSSKYVKTVDFTNKSSDFGEWQQVLPTTGYFVGFEVLPLADMNNYSYVTHGGNVNSVNYFTIVVHNSKDNYVIAKPKYDAPEGLVVKGNTVSNLDDELTYVAYQVNVNGYDLENYVTIKNATEYTFADDEVGLWAITIPGDANYDASDAGAYVFNRALHSNMKKIGTYENDLPLQVGGTPSNKFTPGYFSYTSTYSGSVVEDANKDRTDTYKTATAGTYRFLQTAMHVDKDDPDVLAIFNSETSATDLVTHKANLLKKLHTGAMTYAYAPDEIVPAKELNSFKYGIAKNQGMFYNFAPSVIFHTIDSEGVKHEYTWKGNEQWTSIGYVVASWTVDAKATLAEAGDDEVVVALEFKPFGAWEANDIKFCCTTFEGNSFNNAVQLHHFWYYNSYNITKPQAAAPTELELVGKKITGFLDGVDYKYAPVTVNGVDYNAAADLTEATTLGVGLWAAYYPENDDFTASLPAVFFVRGSASARQEIGTMMGTAPTGYTKYPQYATKNEDGTWTIGQFVSNGKRPIQEPSGTVNDSRYAFWITSFHGASTLTSALNADNATNIATARADIKTAYEAMTLRYAYNQDEVIPVDELLNFKVETRISQGPFKNLYAKPKVVFTVVKEDGSMCYPSWTGEQFTVNGGAQTINTVTLTEDILTEVFAGVDGYVVAFEYSPWSNVDSSEVIPQTSSTTGAYITYDTNFWFYFYHGTSDYAVAEDPAEINASLLLDGKIGLKIEADFKDASITEATYEGFTPDSFTVNDGIATAIVYVAPKDASTVALTGSITAGGETLEFADVTVATCISAYTESSNELLKALATALDVYCDYAENYFSDADALPEVELSDDETLALSAEITAQRPDDNALEAVGLKLKSSSLILEGATTIRHYFTIIDADAYTSSGLALDKYSDDICYIEAENIAAHQLSTAAEAVVADGLVIKFSAIDYAKLTFEGNSKLANLVRALYKYSVAADAYWDFYGDN